MAVQQLHHVAYRCNDAKQTADFYIDILGLKYYAAVSEDTVPSTGEKCPYMHIFFCLRLQVLLGLVVVVNYLENKRCYNVSAETKIRK